MAKVRPFLKWAGGKYRSLDRILRRLPKGRRLVEPFVGSGAVFLNSQYSSYLLTDTNPDLIGCYEMLKSHPNRLIQATRDLFSEMGNTRQVFDALRLEFNALPSRKGNVQSRIRKAALFIYLNRHCFNGLCRYNRSGGFNVPFGRYTKPYFPETELLAFSEKLQLAELRCVDFRGCFEELQTGDVVYCDPPYVPLSATANFTAYSENGFGQKDQEALKHLAQKASSRGIPVLISNHETPFTKALYSQARRTAFPVRRFISCKGNKRQHARELLAEFC